MSAIVGHGKLSNKDKSTKKLIERSHDQKPLCIEQCHKRMKRMRERSSSLDILLEIDTNHFCTFHVGTY